MFLALKIFEVKRKGVVDDVLTQVCFSMIF